MPMISGSGSIVQLSFEAIAFIDLMIKKDLLDVCVRPSDLVLEKSEIVKNR